MDRRQPADDALNDGPDFGKFDGLVLTDGLTGKIG
ncbi:hypothetical protein FP2506_00545 [Fulvimarina pelagi HTCC2506]|uniref:Uncharacterized protein n=1 Tax=Fulvimarina pelagi HTCC2506 TaxID=314231 RepID=Q0FXC4_9HYPH|nr:hypothetical protein FP2506_00545 [Fulvimarina pelagi HTCC2506]